MPALVTAGSDSGKAPHRRLALVVALASLLFGCGSPTGDFGRPKPDPLVSLKKNILATRDSVTGFVGLAREDDGSGPEAERHTSRPDRARGDGLTLPEQELRRRLAHFRSALGPWRETSAIARFNALADRAAEDDALLAEALALRPIIADRQRTRAGGLRLLSQAGPHAGSDSRATDAENRRLFVELCRRARQRAHWLRRELETQLIGAPEIEAVPAERRLLALEVRIAEGCAGGEPASPAAAMRHRSRPAAPSAAGNPDAPPLPLAPPLVTKG
jgi:hypothetical protein